MPASPRSPAAGCVPPGSPCGPDYYCMGPPLSFMPGALLLLITRVVPLCCTAPTVLTVLTRAAGVPGRLLLEDKLNTPLLRRSHQA